MDLLVTYDVNTTTRAGRKRLRTVAKACEGFGQRVQCSVFECTVTHAQRVELSAKLQAIISQEEDSLRIYLLRGGRDNCIESHGRDQFVDFDDPLII